MLTPASPYADLPARLAALQQQEVRAFVRHAERPDLLGPDGTHRALWAARYEAGCALAEQNPAFARALLPRSGATVLAGPGLPLVPAGVHWVLDEAGPDTLTLTIELAAPSISVRPPVGLAFLPLATLGATRTTTTFTARQDGLYAITLSVAGLPLPPFYVPVQRAAFRRFREDSRALDWAFRPTLPRPSGVYRRRLALLIAKEAAARTGQTGLFARLDAAEQALPTSPTPIHRYPHG